MRRKKQPKRRNTLATTGPGGGGRTGIGARPKAHRRMHRGAMTVRA